MGFMGFFSSPSPKEIEREQQKELKSTTRDLDRELRTLTIQEQKLESEIKMLAKKNQEQAARILAKQLIETRQQKTRIMGMKSQISSTSIQSKQVQTKNVMAKSIATSAASMKLSNQQMNPMQTQAIMQAYDKESLKMEMGTEMMDDVFDSVFEGDADAEDDLVNQVYDEIGLDFSQSAAKVPKSKVSNNTKVSEDDLNKFLSQYEQ